MKWWQFVPKQFVPKQFVRRQRRSELRLVKSVEFQALILCYELLGIPRNQPQDHGGSMILGSFVTLGGTESSKRLG